MEQPGFHARNGAEKAGFRVAKAIASLWSKRLECKLLRVKEGGIDCKVPRKKREKPMVRVRASQQFFTDEEVARLFQVGLEEVRRVAQLKHLGMLSRAAEAAGVSAGRLLFTLSDLMVLSVLWPRLEH
jgi:hypothetical protein